MKLFWCCMIYKKSRNNELRSWPSYNNFSSRFSGRWCPEALPQLHRRWSDAAIYLFMCLFSEKQKTILLNKHIFSIQHCIYLFGLPSLWCAVPVLINDCIFISIRVIIVDDCIIFSCIYIWCRNSQSTDGNWLSCERRNIVYNILASM